MLPCAMPHSRRAAAYDEGACCTAVVRPRVKVVQPLCAIY